MIERLLNPWIRDLIPYSSARSEFSAPADILLDANESWEGGNSGINRYPDPLALKLRKKMEEVLSLPLSMTAIGNGSDEIIDMLIRMFCIPGKDSILIERPTYGTYSVFAHTSGVDVINVMLTPSLDLDADAMLETIERKKPKIVFICTPNNPTGRVYPLSVIRAIAEANSGITAIDEAYCDFADGFESAVSLINSNPRVVVLRTLSKAYGVAGARLGILVSDPEVQRVFMKAKPPYNVSSLSQEAGYKALCEAEKVRERVRETKERRTAFSSYLASLPFVEEVFPSQANFVLIRVQNAKALYDYLVSRSIIVRNRSSEPMLDNTIRITIGSEEEMQVLKEALDEWK